MRGESEEIVKSRESLRFFIRLALAVVALALIARHIANTDGIGMTRAQSPLPTSTFTPIPPTPTDTPVPPTPTDTPMPPTPTDTPVPPTPTDTPVPPTPTDTPAPPVCSEAVPSIATLWPPNHVFVAVEVLGVNDPEGDSVEITIDGILQDEAVDAPGSGSTSRDGRGVGTGTAEVRAERACGGNGRVYHITFTADDGDGGTCSGEVLIGVPKSRWHTPVDDGALYDSTVVIP
jgi:hypothetical protein